HDWGNLYPCPQPSLWSEARRCFGDSSMIDGRWPARELRGMPAPRDPGMAALLERRDVARARTRIYDDDARTLAEQRELTEIAAPPCGEGPRSARMAELMKQSALEGVGADGLGNVVGWLGSGRAAPLVVSAHLDTIFPAGTDVRVRAEGDRLVGPGISD